MPSVFKYAERVWSDLLINKGGVRIGTLHDYRKSEHKRGISDAVEGKKTISHHVKHHESKNKFGIDHAAVTNLGPFKTSGKINISYENLNFSRAFDAADCYIHCTAHVLGRDVLEQFEAADSCIEIFKPAAFYRHLTELINKQTQVHFFGLHRVVYSGRDEAFNGENFGLRPDLIKDPEFSPQCEVRAIWIPKSKKKIQPFNLQDKSLVKFCKSVEIP